MADESGWFGMGLRSWSDLAEVRARLAAGAVANATHRRRPLHEAAEYGSADVVAELAGLVDDVDAEHDGRTAL
ncbi:hypothetical protein NCC78_11125 [Micromonospora phytophila]|uniref:hypothetical protein n=1 Tax=Micromonospora phytophila TaxID=709888 RepID=UPI00202F4E51|nr:hypothetical protein [Micromonospora phytophila]MCM0675234.1 hypothetical protein [Micromonospora phytophila]